MAGGWIVVGADESTPSGIVITALEVIEACFSVLTFASIGWHNGGGTSYYLR